jgi:octaprenyl-diphosphate synthase
MTAASTLLSPQETERINEAIRTNLQGPVPFLADIIRYLIDSNYTPYRSFLLQRTCELFETTIPSEIPHTASTLEFLHTASVLHRNITHNDNARRELRSLSNIWGNEASLLLGDYLLSISFQTLTRLGQLDVLETISWATRNIARGQILEVAEPLPQISPAQCLQVYREKQASLLAAAAQCGAIWGKGSSTQQQALFHYGENWGVALVLQKDLQTLENYEDFAEQMQQQRQVFYPLALWLADLEHTSRSMWQQHLSDPSESSLCELQAHLQSTREETQRVLSRHIRLALEALDSDEFLAQSALPALTLAPVFPAYV